MHFVSDLDSAQGLLTYFRFPLLARIAVADIIRTNSRISHDENSGIEGEGVRFGLGEVDCEGVGGDG